MKATLLLLTSIFPAAAWKKSHFPLAFFAKVNDSLIPLYGNSPGDLFEDLGMFSYGNKKVPPIEFTLHKNHASTRESDTPGYVGFDKPFFIFGPTVSPADLNLKSDGQVINGPFYSCHMANSNEYGILYRPKNVQAKHCFEVDIYLLPYEKVNEASKKKFYMQDNHKKHGSVRNKDRLDKSLYMSSNVPLGFFAKVNHTLMPLSGQVFKILRADSSVISYGESSTAPIQFTLRNGYVSTKEGETPGYAGFYGDLFVFGPMIPKTKIKLNSKMRVQNSRFYSCRSHFNQDRVISTTRWSYCFAVSIYLLPFYEEDRDAFNNLAVPKQNEKAKLTPGTHFVSNEKKYMQKKDEESTPDQNGTDISAEKETYSYNNYQNQSVQFDEKQNLGVVYDEHPMSIFESLGTLMAFFARFNGSWVPLSGQIFPEFKKDRSVLSYNESSGTPVVFHLEGGCAITKDATTPGYADVGEKAIVFGPTVSQTKLLLDDQMRLQNSRYFSCQSFKNSVNVITTSKEYDFCSEVDIYILPYKEPTDEDDKGMSSR